MTIASEITRLQNDKAAICTAIENKGVTVGNVTLDDYASCIDAISSGGGICVDVLIVGGGGSGGCGGYGYYGGGGGGGAGGAFLCNKMLIEDLPRIINVGKGGCNGQSGGYSTFGDLLMYGGGGGGWLGHAAGSGGSGGGAGGTNCQCGVYYCDGGSSKEHQGYNGGISIITHPSTVNNHGGGGGGAGGAGGVSRCNNTLACSMGGIGIISDIDGTLKCYAGGGGAGLSGPYGCQVGACGQYGGGNGGGCSYVPTSATTCGSGGGGGSGYYQDANKIPGNGADGIVVVRYPTDGSYGITNGAGGCKYMCGNYTIHCFTSSGAFFPSDITGKKFFSYLVVGGGGGGYNGGGGGGDVCCSVMEAKNNSYSITVGAGGAPACAGCSSSIVDVVTAEGGKGGSWYGYCGGKGGTSGSGMEGGNGGGGSAKCGGGGGGGASAQGCPGCSYTNGFGGAGKYGYGGGGGGGACANYCFISIDGGGCGTYNCPARATPTNCGGGGGGAWSSSARGTGACGVVDICYPCDGSWGFSNATGGNSCYLCGNICVHRFTSDGTFIIVN